MAGSSSSDTTGADGAASAPRAGLALGLLCAVQAVLQFDFSVVNVALPTIKTDLGFSGAGLQWIITGYALSFGALLLFGGRAGDLFGQRRMLVIGMVGFGVTSLICGLAIDPVMLIVARILEGAAAALASPSALSALTLLFPDGPARVRALGLWQAATAVGSSAGIVLGGVLVQLVGWRSVFFVKVPIVALLVIAVPFVLPKAAKGAGRSLELVPSLLVTLAIALLIVALSRSEQDGLLGVGTLVPAAAAVVLAVVFVVGQRRSKDPLIPPVLLGSVARRGALVAVLVSGGIVSSYVYFVTQYLQLVLRFDPLLTGIGLLPSTIVVIVVSSFLAKRVNARLGTRLQAVIGAVALIAGQALLATVSSTGGYLANVLPGLVLTAVGMGLLPTALSIAIVGGVPEESEGEAASLLTTGQQVGAAVVIAVLAVAAEARSAGGGGLAPGFSLAFLISAVLMVGVAVLVLLTLPRIGRRPAAPVATAAPSRPPVVPRTD